MRKVLWAISGLAVGAVLLWWFVGSSEAPPPTPEAMAEPTPLASRPAPPPLHPPGPGAPSPAGGPGAPSEPFGFDELPTRLGPAGMAAVVEQLEDWVEENLPQDAGVTIGALDCSQAPCLLSITLPPSISTGDDVFGQLLATGGRLADAGHPIAVPSRTGGRPAMLVTWVPAEDPSLARRATQATRARASRRTPQRDR